MTLLTSSIRFLNQHKKELLFLAFMATLATAYTAEQGRLYINTNDGDEIFTTVCIKHSNEFFGFKLYDTSGKNGLSIILGDINKLLNCGITQTAKYSEMITCFTKAVGTEVMDNLSGKIYPLSTIISEEECLKGASAYMVSSFK